MTVKKSVFASKGEERGFQSIEHTWGDNYRVLPQFPFSALFEPDRSIRDSSNYFYKTSIDYVFCTKEGEPILAIDFDGLGEGYIRDGQYVQGNESNQRNRKWGFDFKIQYADKNNFPYYVVASGEFKNLGEEISLTIVDGIIGSVLAKRGFDDQIPLLIEEQRGFIDNLPPHERQDYIQDLVLAQELDSDVKYSKIFEKMVEIKDANPGLDSLGVGYSYFEDPALPDLEGPLPFGSPESLSARSAAMEHVETLGCVCTLYDTPVGEVSEVATMRNIGHSFQYLSLLGEIAELSAWAKCSRLLSRRSHSA